MNSVISLADYSWGGLIANRDHYDPIIMRLVGYYLLHDCRSNEDHDPFGADATATVPGLKDLTEREQEFVHAGALAVYYQGDVNSDVLGQIDDWIREGAPQ